MTVSNISIIIIILYYMFLFSAVVFKFKINERDFLVINIIFLVAVIIVSYNLVPHLSLDIFRYFHYLDRLREVKWFNLFEDGAYANTFITQVYFYVISKIGNYALLGTIPTAILFLLLFNACRKMERDYKVSFQSQSLFILSVISMATLAGIISGLRQDFTWVLLMSAVYYDFYSKKKKNYITVLLYILPLMVHVSALPFILLRLIIPVIIRMPKLIWVLLFWPVIILVADIIKVLLPAALQNPLSQLVNYVDLSFGLSPQILVPILGYFILFYFVYKLPNELITSEINKRYIIYYISILFFGMASYVVPVLFIRTFELIMYLSLPFYSIVLKTEFRFKEMSLGLLLLGFLLLFYYTDLHGGYPFLS